MLAAGPARKVTIYLNEDAQAGRHRPLHQAVLQFLLDNGVSGATAMRAMAGFGGHHVIHTARIELMAEHLPILVEFVETPEKVAELLPALSELVTDGMIEMQETTIVKCATRR